MTYEYEEIIKEELEFTDLDNTDNQDKMLKELQEVYRKAKVLDEILNLPDTYGYAEEYSEDVDIILSEYMEDEQMKLIKSLV